jgi:2'-5' RNA ligase
VETLRTFIAIELPANVRAKIAEHINRLRRECPDVRASWSREDILHLTLKFLGDVPIERIPALSNAIEQAVQHIPPFDLIVKDCGAFPPHGRPKVLWIGVEAGSADILSASSSAGPAPSQSPSPNPQHPLASLHAAIEDRCAAAGFERDARAFHPHLTIARLRDSKGSRALAQRHQELGFDSLSVKVKDVCVMRSVLSSQGSQHTVISRHGFK